jgi:hypothetical protein
VVDLVLAFVSISSDPLLFTERVLALIVDMRVARLALRVLTEVFISFFTTSAVSRIAIVVVVLPLFSVLEP